MKSIKLAFAVTALSLSASASAMPNAVPTKWYDLMMHRLGIINSNSGFCQAQPDVWICWTDF